MGYLSKQQISKLWIRMKSYINARLEGLDSTVANLVAEAGYTKMELLWENASPTSEFGEQTVSISNLQDYDLIMIRSKFSSGAYESIVGFYKTATGSTGTIAGTNNVIGARDITINDNSISFKVGTERATYNGGQSTNNNICIPVEIYGIKGVK